MTFSQKRFVDLGQNVFFDLVKGYHDRNKDWQIEGKSDIYERLAEMSFLAAEEFAKTFQDQEYI
jgi:hypothetical protein